MKPRVTLFTGYILDANAIIDIARRMHPPDIRKQGQEIVDRLIEQDLIAAPKEVYRELNRKAAKGDEVMKWCDDRKDIFIELTPEQEICLGKVVSENPGVVKLNVEDFDADPLLIAMGMDMGWTVVTADGVSAPDNSTKVHPVCRKYGVKCVSISEFLREHGWPT